MEKIQEKNSLVFYHMVSIILSGVLMHTFDLKIHAIASSLSRSVTASSLFLNQF